MNNGAELACVQLIQKLMCVMFVGCHFLTILHYATDCGSRFGGSASVWLKLPTALHVGSSPRDECEQFHWEFGAKPTHCEPSVAFPKTFPMWYNGHPTVLRRLELFPPSLRAVPNEEVKG